MLTLFLDSKLHDDQNMSSSSRRHGSDRDRRKGRKSSSSSSTPLPVPSIPWTQQETEALTEVVEYLSLQLQEDDEEGVEKLPREDAKELLHFLQHFLKQDHIDRQDPLLTKIAYYFNQLQCVDLARIASSMKENRVAGNELEEQDVILLLGGSSSGKTTTLHSLAGTTFKEVEVDGFVHLKPTQFLDASVAGFETSSSRTAVTKKLQTCKVQMHDQEYLVCDTPGFGVFDTVEEEICNGLGLVNAVSKARTIRPVFVFSQECLGNRLSGFQTLFQMMTKLFEIDPSEETIPFQYVFTRFDERHRSRLCKMFKYLTETVSNYDEDQQEVFLRVIEDIVEKTTPEANIVSPIGDIPRFLLRSLLENKDLVCEPRDWMRPFASDEALAALHTQLKLTLHGLHMYLASGDYDRAVERMRDLQALQEVMPDARDYASAARNACLRHAIMLYESFNERIEKKDFGTAMARVTSSMKLGQVLPDADETYMLTPETFWERFTFSATHENYIMSVESVKQLRRMTKTNADLQGEFKRGIRMIRNDIQKRLDRGEDLAKGACLLTQLVMLSQGFPDAADFSADLLQKFEKQLMRLIHKKEFKAATEQMMALGNLAREFPEQAHFAHYGVKMYKHALERALEKKFYEHSADLLLDLVELEPYYRSAEKYVTKGMEQLWKHFSDAIKQREYCTSVCIVKHMSKLAHSSPVAYEKTRLGIEVIRDRLFKSIENKNYNMAQVLMQQLTKLEKMLPKKAPKSKKELLARKEKEKLVKQEEIGSSTGATRSTRREKEKDKDKEKRSPSPAERSIPSPLRSRRDRQKSITPVKKRLSNEEKRDTIPSPLVNRREEYTPQKTQKKYYYSDEEEEDDEEYHDTEPRTPTKGYNTPAVYTRPLPTTATRNNTQRHRHRQPHHQQQKVDDETTTVSQITMDTYDFRSNGGVVMNMSRQSCGRHNPTTHSTTNNNKISATSTDSMAAAAASSRRSRPLLSDSSNPPTTKSSSRSRNSKKSSGNTKSSRNRNRSRNRSRSRSRSKSALRPKSSFELNAERELLMMTADSTIVSEKTSFSF